MNWRNHGANPEKLYRQFNVEKPSKIIDFSTNTNVLPIEINMGINLECSVKNYPDDESIELRELVSNKNCIDRDCILFTNGANEAIYLLASYYHNKRVGILQPTYSEYEKALKAYGAEVVYLYDLDSNFKDLDAVFICNPNNPTGSFIDFESIVELTEKLLEKNIELIIDESYIDFLNRETKSIDVSKHMNVYLLRSLTKIYHLSGLRIGYVLSNKCNIEKLKNRQPTWSVNSIAQHYAYKFIKDDVFINKTKKYYHNEKKRLVSNLSNIGYKILSSDVNFFLLEVDNDIHLIKYLLERGIVVRHTRNFPGLDGNYLRIAVRTKDENDILINALREYRI